MSGSDIDPDIKTRLRIYLAAHATAADTPRGIVSFWLGLPPTLANIAETEEALARLEAEGLVGSRVLASGTTLWFGRGGEG